MYFGGLRLKIYVGKKSDYELRFETIKEAKDYLKENNVNEPVEVIILEGRYHFNDTLRFGKDDVSATYKAEGKVIFDGGIIIDNSLVKKVTDEKVLERLIEDSAKDYIYEIDLSSYEIVLGEYGARGFRHPYILYTIFYSCSLAGTNQNSFNISYSYVDSKYITQAMAIKNSIGGICGFGASILGGKILEVIQKNGNSIFGLHIYGQQVLGGISLFILIGTIIFMNKVIVKQTVMKQ